MNTFCKLLVITLGMACCMQAYAGVVIGGTRLIYDGNKKESSLSISNPDKSPYLIQSWVSAQETDTSKVPFIITPPIFRLDGGQDNILRVIRAGGNLPDDKESLYWLNIKSIPSAEKKNNTLQIAVKTSIKLIYRPGGVKGKLEEAAQSLQWQRNGNQLRVSNDSPFYISFFNVKVNGVALKDTTMVAPRSSANFSVSAGGGSEVSWQIINDFGGASKVFNAAL